MPDATYMWSRYFSMPELFGLRPSVINCGLEPANFSLEKKKTSFFKFIGNFPFDNLISWEINDPV